MPTVENPGERAETEAGLLEVALTDQLTGLHNRRCFDRRLPEALKRAESASRPLSLFVLDVDYFKDINDTYGHPAGDETLSKIAGLLGASLRDTGTVFRWAGDEFAVTLADTDNETAMEVARKIADRVSSRALEVLGKAISVTISVGVATYPEDGEDPATLFGFADRALYATKRRGRNGVCGRREVVEDAELLRPASCPELVGRKEELSKLKELLALSFEGKGSLVFLSGEAGVGKTRLLNEFAESARRRGALVLSGRCFGEPTSFPYQPFKDALRKYSEGGDGERRRMLQSLPDVYRNELLGLIPELVELGVETSSTPELEADQARLRLFDAVRQFLLGISKERPLTVILEDLHSADESSSQLLHYLARNLRESPVLICGAFRREEIDVAKGGKTPLGKAMHSMSRDELFSSISLRRLSLGETSRMIGLILNNDEVPEPLCKRIYRETEGNPFFVEEVLKSLIEAGKVSTKLLLDKVDLDGLEIPAAIRDVIRRRLDMLDPETNRILTFGSVIGHSFSFGALLLMSELNEGHLLDLIDQALRSQLIVEEGEEEYGFSHGKIRETIYEGIARRKRKRLHRVVGESLESVYGKRAEEHASDLSYHFHQAEDWEKCFEYSSQAGRRAKEVYANDEAISSYERALGTFHRLSSEEQAGLLDSTLALHQDRGDVLELLGRYDDAINSYQEMREAAKRAGERGAGGWALRGIGWVHWRKGSYDEALRYLRDAVAIFRQIGDKKHMAYSLDNIGTVHDSKGSYDQALKYYGESLAVFREIGDKSGTAFSLNNMAEVNRIRGSYDEALRYLEDAVAIFTQIGDKRHMAYSLNNMGNAYWSRGSYDDALKYYCDSLAICRDIGDRTGVATSLDNIGLVHADRGSCGEALRCHEDALAIKRQVGDRRGIAISLNNIGLVYSRKGSYDQALRCHEESLAVKREIGYRSGVAFSLYNIGEVRRGKGSYDEALRYHEESLAIRKDTGDKRGIAYSLNDIGLVHLEKASYDEASRCYEDALAMFEEMGDRKGIAETLLSKGGLRRQLSFLDDAVRLHEQSLVVARQIGDRKTESRALTELGIDMLRCGNFSECLSRLNEALAIETEDIEAEIDALHGLAETYITLNECEQASQAIGKLTNIAEGTNSMKYLAEAYLLSARSLPPQEALPYAEKALKLSEAMGSPEPLWRAHQLLGRILKENGDHPSAKTHCGEAKAIVESIASKLSDPEVRESYLSKPEHKKLFDECEQLTD